VRRDATDPSASRLRYASHPLVADTDNGCAVFGDPSDQGVPCLSLGEVHMAARIVHGRAQCPCSGDHSNQDSERDDPQFDAVAGAHKWIAPTARTQNSPHVDRVDASHDHSISRNELVTGSEPLSRVRGGHW
jgi:hypothetical protein